MKELAKIIKDGADELHELMTDGFHEMVIKGNNDYKTSFEKKELASEIVSKAEARYKRVYKEVKNKYEKINRIVKEHYEFKSAILNDIKKYYSPKIKELKHNISDKNKFLDFINNTAKYPSAINNLNIAVGCIIGPMLLSKIRRVSEANIMLEEAEKYQAKLNLEEEKLKKIKSKLIYIEKTIIEERELIHRLFNPLDVVINKVHSAPNNSELMDFEKANKMLEVIIMLERTLTTNLIKKDGKINEEYLEIIEHMKLFKTQTLERGI